MTALHAGHCSICDTEVFVGVFHPGTGKWFPLWPLADSVYARFSQHADRPDEAHIIGIAYCGAHAPPIGAPPPPGLLLQQPHAGSAVSVDTAWGRYKACFSDGYGRWMLAWLRSEAKVDPVPWMGHWAIARLAMAPPEPPLALIEVAEDGEADDLVEETVNPMRG